MELLLLYYSHVVQQQLQRPRQRRISVWLWFDLRRWDLELHDFQQRDAARLLLARPPSQALRARQHLNPMLLYFHFREEPEQMEGAWRC